MLDSKKPPWGKLHQISVCQMRQHSSSNELLWVLLYILDSLKIDVISKSGWLDTHTSLSIPTPHIPTSPFNGASLSTPYIYYIYIQTHINTLYNKIKCIYSEDVEETSIPHLPNQSHLVCRWYSCLDVVWLQCSWMGREYSGFLKQFVLIWYTQYNVIKIWHNLMIYYNMIYKIKSIMQHK